MRNGDVQAAWTYHDVTKHSPERLRCDPHHLDFDTQPVPYTLYTTLAPQPLPRDWPVATTPALAAIAGAARTPGEARVPRVPTLAELARLLLLSAGITRKVVYANGHETYFRAAPCTGALYHVDLYVVCGALPGLDAGVYHFGPHDFALRLLRPGDHRPWLTEASGEEPAIAAAAAVLVSVSTIWRNAWKYRARAYRHCFWDNGTLLANALAAAAAVDMPARLVTGFVDTPVERLLDLDGTRQLVLSLLAIGDDPTPRPAAAVEPAALALATQPARAPVIAYPAITTMHTASTLESADEVRAWRASALDAPAAERGGRRVPLRALAVTPQETIDAVIHRRGSSRAFTRAAIGFAELSTILVQATQGLEADFVRSRQDSLAELYLIVHAVDGLASGTYVHRRDDQSLELLRAGDFRREAGFLALGQELAADASVDCYLLVDLSRTLAALGNRGYRAAQLEAAITGGRIYLAAYALRLGATGLTFFDDAVTDFFAPHAAGKSVMFLVAVGRGRARSRP
ncbi:MAG: SagB/ThcOx family dehydrogenase [Deltaproteobacteria bacterium]|nr:SagB/ThcOx family dehydrogenase [Deltaproteobacteria bacterium]